MGNDVALRNAGTVAAASAKTAGTVIAGEVVSSTVKKAGLLEGLKAGFLKGASAIANLSPAGKIALAIAGGATAVAALVQQSHKEVERQAAKINDEIQKKP